MQVCPSMQISETQTSCIAVKKDQYPAAQMSFIEKDFELHLAAQPSPQLPNSEGDSTWKYKISDPYAYQI